MYTLVIVILIILLYAITHLYILRYAYTACDAYIGYNQ